MDNASKEFFKGKNFEEATKDIKDKILEQSDKKLRNLGKQYKSVKYLQEYPLTRNTENYKQALLDDLVGSSFSVLNKAEANDGYGIHGAKLVLGLANRKQLREMNKINEIAKSHNKYWNKLADKEMKEFEENGGTILTDGDLYGKTREATRREAAVYSTEKSIPRNYWKNSSPKGYEELMHKYGSEDNFPEIFKINSPVPGTHNVVLTGYSKNSPWDKLHEGGYNTGHGKDFNILKDYRNTVKSKFNNVVDLQAAKKDGAITDFDVTKLMIGDELRADQNIGRSIMSSKDIPGPAKKQMMVQNRKNRNIQLESGYGVRVDRKQTGVDRSVVDFIKKHPELTEEQKAAMRSNPSLVEQYVKSMKNK